MLIDGGTLTTDWQGKMVLCCRGRLGSWVLTVNTVWLETEEVETGGEECSGGFIRYLNKSLWFQSQQKETWRKLPAFFFSQMASTLVHPPTPDSTPLKPSVVASHNSYKTMRLSVSFDHSDFNMSRELCSAVRTLPRGCIFFFSTFIFNWSGCYLLPVSYLARSWGRARISLLFVCLFCYAWTFVNFHSRPMIHCWLK